MSEAQWNHSLSLSQNSLAVTKYRGKAGRKAPENRYPHERLQLDVTQILYRKFFHFLKNVTPYAHKVTSAMCNFLRFEVRAGSWWGPNNVLKNEELVWYCCWLCNRAFNFKRVSVSTSHDFLIIDTSSLYKYDSERREANYFDMLFFPVCIIKEAHRGALFTTRGMPQKASIVKSSPKSM